MYAVMMLKRMYEKVVLFFISVQEFKQMLHSTLLAQELLQNYNNKTFSHRFSLGFRQHTWGF